MVWMVCRSCQNHPPVRIFDLLINRIVERVELTPERCGVTLSIWKEQIPGESKLKRGEMTSLEVRSNQRRKAQEGERTQSSSFKTQVSQLTQDKEIPINH